MNLHQINAHSCYVHIHRDKEMCPCIVHCWISYFVVTTTSTFLSLLRMLQAKPEGKHTTTLVISIHRVISCHYCIHLATYIFINYMNHIAVHLLQYIPITKVYNIQTRAYLLAHAQCISNLNLNFPQSIYDEVRYPACRWWASFSNTLWSTLCL